MRFVRRPSGGLEKMDWATTGNSSCFLDVESDDELVHAVCAFGPDSSADIADALVAILTDAANSDRRRASASFVLARTIPLAISAPRLVAICGHRERFARNWALATLGQMDPIAIRPYVTEPTLAIQLEPLHLTSPETNWTRSERLVDMLAFVRKQTVPAGEINPVAYDPRSSHTDLLTPGQTCISR